MLKACKFEGLGDHQAKYKYKCKCKQASLEEWEIIGPSKGERAAGVISRIKVQSVSPIIIIISAKTNIVLF